MPCLSDGADSYLLNEARAENHKLTRLLCEVMPYMEHVNCSHELLAWWEAHQKADAERQAREQAEYERLQTRERAIAKLTPEEKALLGIR